MFVHSTMQSLFIARARIVGFWWGVAEATVFFILPDFFLAPAIIARPTQAWRLVLSITAGSAVGALLISLYIVVAPNTMYDLITVLPFTNEAMIAKASLYSSNPFLSILQPVSGVPMKAWIWSMIAGGTSFVAFFVVMMLARVLRFVSVALIALLAERFFGDLLRRYAIAFFAVYGAVFLLFLAHTAGAFS